MLVIDDESQELQRRADIDTQIKQVIHGKVSSGLDSSISGKESSNGRNALGAEIFQVIKTQQSEEYFKNGKNVLAAKQGGVGIMNEIDNQFELRSLTNDEIMVNASLSATD